MDTMGKGGAMSGLVGTTAALLGLLRRRNLAEADREGLLEVTVVVLERWVKQELERQEQEVNRQVIVVNYI